jgi:hypothetical protein
VHCRLLPLLLLAGCSQFSLSADDQDFCAGQSSDPIAYLRSEVDDLIEDNHWQGDGEAFAFQTVTLDYSEQFLSGWKLQDDELSDIREGVIGGVFDAQLAADEGDTMDREVLQDLEEQLRRLEVYCMANA